MIPWWYEYVEAYVMLEVIDAKKNETSQSREPLSHGQDFV